MLHTRTTGLRHMSPKSRSAMSDLCSLNWRAQVPPEIFGTGGGSCGGYHGLSNSVAPLIISIGWRCVEYGYSLRWREVKVDVINNVHRLRSLAREAKSSKSNILRRVMTHLPKNPYCPQCERANMEQVPLFRKGRTESHARYC